MVFKLEQFFIRTPEPLKTWLRDKSPGSLYEAAKLADQYVATHKSFGSDNVNKPNYTNNTKVTHSKTAENRSDNDWSWRQKTNPKPSLAHSEKSHGSSQATRPSLPSGLRCAYCKRPGHDVQSCFILQRKREREREERPEGQHTRNREVSLVQTTPGITGEIAKEFLPYCSQATIHDVNGVSKSVVCLRDTGSMQSLVTRQLLSTTEFRETGDCRLIKGVTGDVKSIPLVEIKLHGKYASGVVYCGLVDTLPSGIHVLIGSDLDPVEIPIQETLVVTRSQTKRIVEAEKEISSPNVPDQIGPVNTDVPCNEELGLEKLFEELDCDASLAALTRDQLVSLQHSDPSLKELLEVAEKETAQLGRNYYYMEKGLLLRHCYGSNCPQEPDLGRTQIVVPTSLRVRCWSWLIAFLQLATWV